ncbi:MAG: DUF3137 domain-containing protein [Gammaproteobacteria bacterium]
MKSQVEFLRLYHSELLPALHGLEPLRKEVLAAFWTSIFFISASLPGFFMFYRMGKPSALIIALFPLGWGIYGFFRFDQKKRNYAWDFKNLIISELIKLIDVNLVYYPEQLVSEWEYREADIFRNSIDRYQGDDLVEGTLGATHCRFSEIHHQEKKESVDSKGRRQTRWVTIFKGIFFVADFNKHFQGRTYVFPDAAGSFLGIGKLFEKWSMNRGELVELENPEFEELFTVYSTDQIESRYILSPALMERLVNFRRKADVKMHIAFIHSKLFLALSVRENLFEPKIFSSGINSGYLKDYFRYLELAAGIVEDLNLNLRIWSKR